MNRDEVVIILDDHFQSERLNHKYNIARFYNLVIHFTKDIPALAILLEDDAELFIESMANCSAPYLPKRYKNDLSFMRKLCKANCSLIKSCDLMQNDKECCLITAAQTGSKVLCHCKVLDVDVLLEAFRVDPKGVAISYGPKIFDTNEYKEWKLTQNNTVEKVAEQPIEKEIIHDEKEIVLKFVTKNGLNLRLFPSFSSDRDVIIAAIKQNGLAFQIIEDKFKQDIEIVRIALESNPINFQFISTHLKKDRSLVLKAVTLDGFTLKFVDSIFKQDKEIVLNSFTSNGKAVEFVDKSLWQDEEVVLHALKKTGRTMFYANERIKSNKEIAIKVIQKFPEAFAYLSDDLKLDREFLLSLIRVNHLIFHHLSSTIRDDYSFLIEALEQNSFIFPYLPPHLRYNPDVVVLSVRSTTQFLTDYLYEKPSFSTKFDFAIRCIQQNGAALNSFFGNFPHDETKQLAMIATCSTFYHKHPLSPYHHYDNNY